MKVEENLLDTNNVTKICQDKIEKELYREIKFPLTTSQELRRQLTLSQGDPGLLMLFSNLKNESASSYLRKRIIRNLKMVPIDLSLFSGLSGIGLSFLIYEQEFKLNEPNLEVINKLILNKIGAICKVALQNPSDARSFDLVQGLSGVGQYLLKTIISGSKWSAEAYKKFNEIVKTLKEISDISSERKPFWISKQNQFLPEEMEIYRDGNYNLGMAHGIVGPINLFLDAYKNGLIEKKEYAEKWINELLSFKRNQNGQSLFWPRESGGKEIFPGQEFIERNGWCYGNSIICYTLFKAGLIFKDSKLNIQALELLDFITRSSNKELVSSNLCHGKAGLLTILEQIKRDYFKEESLEKCINNIQSRILNDFSNSYKYGFQDNSIPVIPGYTTSKDKIGILEGSSGIILALQDATAKNSIKTVSWKSMFFLE